MIIIKCYVYGVYIFYEDDNKDYTQCVHFSDIYGNFETYKSILMQIMHKHEERIFPSSFEKVCF